MKCLFCLLLCIPLIAIALFGFCSDELKKTPGSEGARSEEKVIISHIRLSPDAKCLSFVGATLEKSLKWPRFFLIDTSTRKIQVYGTPLIAFYEWSEKDPTKCLIAHGSSGLSVYNSESKDLTFLWSQDISIESPMPDIILLFPHYFQGRIYSLIDAEPEADAEVIVLAQLSDKNKWETILTGNMLPGPWGFLNEDTIICTTSGQNGEEDVSTYTVSTYDISSGNRKNLCKGLFLGCSRDRTYVVVAQPSNDDNYEVFVRDIQKGKARSLRNIVLPHMYVFTFTPPFSWSTHGEKMAYCTEKGILIYDLANDKKTQLTNDPEDIPWDWSKNGYILYSRGDKIFIKKESEKGNFLVFSVDKGVTDNIQLLNSKKNKAD